MAATKGPSSATRECGPQAASQLVAATIRPVFAQPDAARVREPWGVKPTATARALAAWRTGTDRVESAVLASRAVPPEHWRPIGRATPLARRNWAVTRSPGATGAVTRWTDLVGRFPNTPAVVRLVGIIPAAPPDESPVCRRSFRVASRAELSPPPALPHPSLRDAG